MPFSVEVAARLNRNYMRPQALGWQAQFAAVARLVGVADRSPSEWAFAEAVARWQRGQSPPLTPDGVVGPSTWGRMRAALIDRKLMSEPAGSPPAGPKPPPRPPAAGPQSFAPGTPGSEALDKWLVQRNRHIEQKMLKAADDYYAADDLRWFFTYAHAKITQQINNNLQRFQRPNAMLRLNMHFAEEFLRAVDGQPHAGWKKAFKWCQALEKTSNETVVLVGEAEWCGAAMANVHIRMDLSAALKEVGCIPPDDYGNMLVYVKRGALAAQVRLRGLFLGATESLAEALGAPLLKLEVEQWRNAVYEEVCHVPVPRPQKGFDPK